MRSGQCVPDRRVSPVGCMRSCGMRTAEAVIRRAASTERHSPMRSAPPLLVRILCGEQRELLGTPNPRGKRLPCAGTPGATGADLEPVDPQRPARALAVADADAAVALALDDRASRHRPPGRLRQRTRSPADSPSATSSGRGGAAIGSVRIGDGVGLNRDPEASTPTSNHGACSVDAHGDMAPAGGQHDLLSFGQLARSVLVPSADAIARASDLTAPWGWADHRVRPHILGQPSASATAR